MRTQWMMQLVGNWAGDDGWLFRHSDQIRKFNYIGDTSWVHGKVVGKRAEGVHRIVDLEVWIENQRDEVTAPGQASVLLPSREAGPGHRAARRHRRLQARPHGHGLLRGGGVGVGVRRKTCHEMLLLPPFLLYCHNKLKMPFLERLA